MEKPNTNGTTLKHDERNAFSPAPENESGSVLSYEHLSYVVSTEKKGLPKVLVDDISVKVRAGELLAIMGPSGAGKSTLLDLMAFRKDAAEGGLPLMPRNQVNDRVQRVITALGLQTCADQRIGTPISRGISGGQKRRVTAACAMVTFPTAAREVISSIRTLARAEGMIVIASIHQPSLDTLSQFTKVMLLAKGRLCFYGGVGELSGFFEAWGRPVGRFSNPADHAMNFLNTDFGSGIEPTTKGSTSAEDFREFYLTYRSQAQPRAHNAFSAPSAAWSISSASNSDLVANAGVQLHGDYNPNPAVDTSSVDSGKAGPAGTLLWNTLTLAERSVKNYTRNLLAYGVRAGMYGGMGFMLAVAFLAFMSVAGIPGFLEERAVYYRESKNGLYSTLPFVLANTLVNIPFLFLCTVFFTVICYWAIGLNPDAGAFFRFLGFLFLALFTAESQVLVIAALLPIFVAALAICAFLNGFWMSVGGYFIKARSLPRFWYYSFHFMDFQKYAFELLTNVSCPFFLMTFLHYLATCANMSDNEDDKKIVELTDQALTEAGFIGDSAFESVKQTVQITRANPTLLDWLTWWMLECQKISTEDYVPNLPSSLPLGDAPTMHRLSIASGAYTVVAPHLISEFERVHYWHGISPDPPELLYRSDLDSNPFPVHPPGTRWGQLPVKTAVGLFGTALNPIWNTVAPEIIALFKKRSIKYSALMATRFSICDEDGNKKLGPIVIWVATHPNTTSAEAARDASPDVLNILEDHQIEGVVVEWYEGSVEKLTGPPLMRIVDESNPTRHVRRALTAALGMPIATKERENADARGNKHVLRADTTVDYEFKGSGAPKQYVRVCGIRRFQQILAETRDLVTKNVAEAVRLTELIVKLEAKPRSDDADQAEEDDEALEDKKTRLKKELNGQWLDIVRRTIGWVDWAPKIAIGLDERRYTRDIATFELEPAKFKENFQGNVVQLGNKFTSYELKTMFWPNNTKPFGIGFPADGLLRIRGVVTPELLATPDCYDENGDPVFIVGKDGNSTDFTVGRYSGSEAYLCDEFGQESIEVAVYNYSETSGNFSARGDSGSLIFTGDGRMLAILHSGMPKGLSSHVTFATPAWWAIEQIKLKYPNADFNRGSFY
ncbi:hypothetical protein H1R20_g12699, partial [Candolleomyces eurysporus]